MKKRKTYTIHRIGNRLVTETCERRPKMKNKINWPLAIACAFVGIAISLAALFVKSELRKETMETTTPTDTVEIWQESTSDTLWIDSVRVDTLKEN